MIDSAKTYGLVCLSNLPEKSFHKSRLLFIALRVKCLHDPEERRPQNSQDWKRFFRNFFQRNVVEANFGDILRGCEDADPESSDRIESAGNALDKGVSGSESGQMKRFSEEMQMKFSSNFWKRFSTFYFTWWINLLNSKGFGNLQSSSGTFHSMKRGCFHRWWFWSRRTSDFSFLLLWKFSN